MKGFYSEYRAFNSLTPIKAPTSTARAFNVVTIWSTHGRFHAITPEILRKLVEGLR